MNEPQHPSLGMNKTPLQVHPLQAKRMLENSKGVSETPGLPFASFEEFHLTMIRESGDVGSVPIPGTLKGLAKTAAKKLMGDNPEILVDKMGERLAFERTGVRLYDALITKHKAHEDLEGTIPLAVLEEFRSEELEHFRMLQDAMLELGADPTGVTPSADVSGVMGMGLVQVCGDPRIDFGSTLEAILVAELADHDGWEALISLAEGLGQDQLVPLFEQALSEEEEHLSQVRSWVKALTAMKAGVAPKSA